MNANEYQQQAQRTSKINWGNQHGPDIAILGLIGELGSLATVIKKHQRDGDAYSDFNEHLFEEVGDILWYVITTATRLQLKLECWPQERKTFKNTFQGIYNLHENITKLSVEKNSLKDPESSNKTYLYNLIKDILSDLDGILKLFNSDLSVIAIANCNKVLSYWCGLQNIPTRHFDKDFPWYEQLPRKFNVDFIGINKNSSLLLVMDGRQLGDRLTDNSYTVDGYRFHDIFHLANAVTLGWSPVLRDLLKVKRKSNPRTDEIEDGARAAIVEEAVVNHIYDYARPNYLEGMKRVDLDLINRIKNLVRGYQVSECEPWEWQHCILKSYEMFRLLMKHGSGRIELNAENRSMTFHELPEDLREYSD